MSCVVNTMQHLEVKQVGEGCEGGMSEERERCGRDRHEGEEGRGWDGLEREGMNS